MELYNILHNNDFDKDFKKAVRETSKNTSYKVDLTTIEDELLNLYYEIAKCQKFEEGNEKNLGIRSKYTSEYLNCMKKIAKKYNMNII